MGIVGSNCKSSEAPGAPHYDSACRCTCLTLIMSAFAPRLHSRGRGVGGGETIQEAGEKQELGQPMNHTSLFNLYAEYSMQNAKLNEAQNAIKITRRNINNLRYADNTTLMAESEEELKSFLMKVKKESENIGLKLNIQKTKIMVSGPITSWQIDGETMKTVTHFIMGGSKITANSDCCHEIKRCLLLGRKAMTT